MDASNNATDTERPLEATASIVASRGSGQPLIIVGLPRSGTSFLAHVLSAIDDWYVFDDLYCVQKAMACLLYTSDAADE